MMTDVVPAAGAAGLIRSHMVDAVEVEIAPQSGGAYRERDIRHGVAGISRARNRARRAGAMTRSTWSALLLAFIGLAIATQTVGAQDPSGSAWSPPALVSGDIPRSKQPLAVADAFGRVHVFWESVYSPFAMYPNTIGTVIYYSVFDGEDWSIPVDIFVSPGAYSIAYSISATTDESGNIYAAWIGADILFFTSAPIASAADAKAWSRYVRIDERAQSPYILKGADGLLYVFYLSSSEPSGVYFVRSTDQGQHWTSPESVALFAATGGGGRVQDALMAVEGPDHAIHLVVSATSEGGGISYMRSADRGNTWSRATRLDVPDSGFNGIQPGGPSLAVDNKGNLIAVWIATHATDNVSCARYGSVSTNNGESWSTRQRVLAPAEGCFSSRPRIEADSNGNLELVMIGRAKGIVAPFQSRWLSGNWSVPQMFTPFAMPDGKDYEARGTGAIALAISGGNRLFAVWHMNDGRILFSSRVGSAAPIAAKLLPTLVPRPTSAPATAIPPVPTKVGTPFPLDERGPNMRPNDWPLYAGLIPVVALLFLVFLGRGLSSTRS